MSFLEYFESILKSNRYLKPDQVGGQLMMNMTMMDVVSNHLSKVYYRIKVLTIYKMCLVLATNWNCLHLAIETHNFL